MATAIATHRRVSNIYELLYYSRNILSLYVSRLVAYIVAIYLPTHAAL